jgi:hypothetical protein
MLFINQIKPITMDKGIIIATGQEVVILRKQMGRYLIEFPNGRTYWYSRDKIREL